MLLNIILTIVLLYLFTIFINRESFIPSNYIYITEFKNPICSVDDSNCIENGFKNNNITFIRKYMNNDNYKAKQTSNSVLIPKYIF
jgi:hypothetical protein